MQSQIVTTRKTAIMEGTSPASANPGGKTLRQVGGVGPPKVFTEKQYMVR
jgi:hypothetical protein